MLTPRILRIKDLKGFDFCGFDHLKIWSHFTSDNIGITIGKNYRYELLPLTKIDNKRGVEIPV